MTGRSVQARVAEMTGSLPVAQRRIAELVVRDPEVVAFGTARSVAERAGASSPTVVRFATSLGFEGFTELRDAVRSELSESLHSAAERMRQEPGGRLLDRALEVERANVERTFAALDPATLERAGDLLADLQRRVWVLSSSQMTGVASHVADCLGLVRPRVAWLEGSEFRIRTVLANLRGGDVLVTLDAQRHERWLVRTQRDAVERGAVPLALTDRLPCSLDLSGGAALTYACETTSPFDSQVGLLALANLLVSEVVQRLRPLVADRVEAMESTWVDGDLLDL